MQVELKPLKVTRTAFYILSVAQVKVKLMEVCKFLPTFAWTCLFPAKLHHFYSLQQAAAAQDLYLDLSLTSGKSSTDRGM